MVKDAPQSSGDALTLFEASPAHADDLILWSSIVLGAYLILTLTRLLPVACKAKTPHDRIAWVMLSVIILLCGVTGSGATILSGWFPEIAHTGMRVLLKVQLLTCVVLWVITRKRFLSTSAQTEALEAMADRSKSAHQRLARATEILKRGGNHSPENVDRRTE